MVPAALRRAHCAFIFSHPNHELAAYGLIQSLDPRIIYLTDGGGQDRVAQTRTGLASIGRLKSAVFLNHAEDRFYQALLDQDADFFSGVAGQVREALGSDPIDAICSDAIEFYNPVHDLATPIVRSAVGGPGGICHYELPLIHQRPGGSQTS